MLLGVNIDHVATLRQARLLAYPSPLLAALQAVDAGADSVTVHLREDRRHIQDQDVIDLLARLPCPLNLEMAADDAVIDFACLHRPQYCCIVPEKREELTTEGGLDVVAQRVLIGKACSRLAAEGIRVSLFVDPVPEQLTVAADVGADCVELHTGHYANALDAGSRTDTLEQLSQAAILASSQGLLVHAGHGLNYDNVQAICRLPGISELNIGHAIVAESVFVGIHQAVARMRTLLDQSVQETRVSC